MNWSQLRINKRNWFVIIFSVSCKLNIFMGKGRRKGSTKTGVEPYEGKREKNEKRSPFEAATS